MPHLERNKSIFKNLLVDGVKFLNGAAATPNTAATVIREKFNRPIQIERIRLASHPISIAAANDYGSTKLVDLPSSNLIVVGVICNVVGVGDGTGIDDVTDVDYAVGTTALTSTDFSNAGEKNLIAEKDVAAQGVMQAAVSDTEDMLFVAKGTNAIYLNIQDAVATGTGTLTVTGTIDILFIDIGSES